MADKKSPLIDIECDCSGTINYGVVQCKACNGCENCSLDDKSIIQKRIQNQVRVYGSQYTDALGAMNVIGNIHNKPKQQYGFVNWNQMSDRAVPGKQTRYVPGQNASSTRSSITRLRPGSLGPVGKGVDMKHGSYDRYLARIKAPQLKAGLANPVTVPKQGNKTKKYGLIFGCEC